MHLVVSCGSHGLNSLYSSDNPHRKNCQGLLSGEPLELGRRDLVETIYFSSVRQFNCFEGRQWSPRHLPISASEARVAAQPVGQKCSYV
jgi:hypothetical protein